MFAEDRNETPSGDTPTPPLRRGMQQLPSPNRSYRDALESVAPLPYPTPTPDTQPPAASNPATGYEKIAHKLPTIPTSATAEGNSQGHSSSATLSIDQPTTSVVDKRQDESPMLVDSSIEDNPINC